MILEKRLAQTILGQDHASVLDTDGYKFSMAQAGFPLRPETFYMAFRREGAWFNPFDMKHLIQAFKPEMPSLKESGFLQAFGYGLTPAMEQALQGTLTVRGVPQGSWFGPREPIATIHGPSFLVSWLEPLVLMLNYPLQVATAMKQGEREFSVTCSDQGKIIWIVAEALGIRDISVIFSEAEAYTASVRKRADAIVEALGGDSRRAFEVGMRAATCMKQHQIVLVECQKAGINRTSNLRLAYALNMIPVGTTGHEHQQRYGNDVDAFRAIRDTRVETPSYLFDTFNPITIGIPAIEKILPENRSRPFSVRFDSGDQDEQFKLLWKIVKKDRTYRYNFIFEDGYTAPKVHRNELFLRQQGFPLGRAWYGFGGFLANPPSPYTRDKVSAAYKLCDTAGEPRMKFSGTTGKASIPGRPISRVCEPNPMTRMICQWDEPCPEDWGKGLAPKDFTPNGAWDIRYSPETQRMIDALHMEHFRT